MSDSEVKKEFCRCFVLSAIHNARFRDYVCGTIKPDWLEDPDYQLIYEAVISLRRADKPVTFMTVYNYLQRSPKLSDQKADILCEMIRPYIKDLNEAEFRSMLDSVMMSAEEEVGKTLLTEASYKAAELTENGKFNDVFDLYRKIERSSLFSVPVEREFWENVDTLGTAEGIKIKPGIPTGIIGMDPLTCAKVYLDHNSVRKGLGKGELAIIQGLSGMGKSTVMLNIAVHQTLLGYNVDYYTMELPIDYLIHRYWSIMVNIPTAQIISGQRTEEAKEKIKEIQNKFKNHGEIRFYDYTACSLTISEIAKNITISQQERELSTLMVDYADLMEPTRHYNNEWKELDDIIKDLRKIGNEFECSVFTASQSNRSKTDTKTKLQTRFQLSGAFSKAFTCDMLLPITTEEERIQAPTGFEKKEVTKLLIDKNRFGAGGGVLILDVDKRVGRFFDPIPD